MSHSDPDKKILHHEAWPGFRNAFYVVFALSTLYLGYIMFAATGGGHH